jgi:hypothetical protein
MRVLPPEAFAVIFYGVRIMRVYYAPGEYADTLRRRLIIFKYVFTAVNLAHRWRSFRLAVIAARIPDRQLGRRKRSYYIFPGIILTACKQQRHGKIHGKA